MSENNEIMSLENMGVLAKAEIDCQVSTAKAYPRVLKTAVDEAIATATFNQAIAQSCIYSVPRGGKTITGPSVRLAEILISSWGNLHCSTRLVKNDGKFIGVEAIVIDRQKNNIISETVERSIMTSAKHGAPKSFSYDMQSVAISAAASIALRKAVFRLIGKQFIDIIYEAAKQVATGNINVVAQKAIEYFAKRGITQEKIFNYFDIVSVDQITPDIMADIIGIKNAILEGNLDKDHAFDRMYNSEETMQVETNADAVNAKLLAEEAN